MNMYARLLRRVRSTLSCATEGLRWGGERVRLTLSIGLDEAGVVPSDAITDESRQASDFVDSALDTFNDTFGW